MSTSSHMMRVRRIDFAGKISNQRTTSIGGRAVRANLTRTGVLTYHMPDGSVRRELRHPDEVFAKDSLDSLANAPVTDDHPGRVHTGNWQTHAIGHLVGPMRKGEPTRDGEDTVEDEIHIQHAPAIEKLDAGKLQECSAGYDCAYDPTPGTWKGQPYDGVQRDIRYNHIAVGPAGWGRAGPDVRMHLDSLGAGVAWAMENEQETVMTKRVDGDTDIDAGAEQKKMDARKRDAFKAPNRRDRMRGRASARDSTRSAKEYAQQYGAGPATVSQAQSDEADPEAARMACDQRKRDAFKMPMPRSGRRDTAWPRDGQGPESWARAHDPAVIAAGRAVNSPSAVREAQTVNGHVQETERAKAVQAARDPHESEATTWADMMPDEPQLDPLEERTKMIQRARDAFFKTPSRQQRRRMMGNQ